jgi:hypothetical protein
MKLFWMNLTKQKFMHWAAGAIVLFHIVNNITVSVFLSSNVKLLSPIIYERMMMNMNAQSIQIISMVLLYFFGKNGNGSDVDNHKIEGI